ncbi:hypothetical protein AAG570_007323 [Ranatra chinensis]|uniref:Uncharacterized protein n=1 Tax=Ranatra chinensis TaxID=642074 RepID=A0ABD0XVI7_9HEMI
MASKRRNMFQKNKTQETTENATIVIQQASVCANSPEATTSSEGGGTGGEDDGGSDSGGGPPSLEELEEEEMQLIRRQENMKLLDVANTLTLEQLHEFEMKQPYVDCLYTPTKPFINSFAQRQSSGWLRAEGLEWSLARDIGLNHVRCDSPYRQSYCLSILYGSPHHSRSQSVKPRSRPTYLSLPQARTRVASMPNTGAEEQYYRLRHFSITGKGVVNRGDSLRSRRSHSHNSVASTNSTNRVDLETTVIPTGYIYPQRGGSLSLRPAGTPPSGCNRLNTTRAILKGHGEAWRRCGESEPKR